MEFKWVEIDKETGDRPSARFWHTVTVVKSNIYVIGGFAFGKSSPAPTMDVYKLAHAWGEYQWKKIEVAEGAEQPDARCRHSACAHEGKIFIFGGFKDSKTCLNDLWVFDTGTNTWEQSRANQMTQCLESTSQRLRRWPRPRGSHTANVIGGHMYVFGGYGGGGRTHKELDDFWMLDLRDELSAWKIPTNTSKDKPKPRSGHASAVAGERLYVYGGWSRRGFNGNVYQYHVGDRVWVHVRIGLPRPRRDHCMVGVPTTMMWRVLVLMGCAPTSAREKAKKKPHRALRGCHLNDLCVMDATEHAVFSHVHVDGLPPRPRCRHAASVDTEAKRVYVFGGWGHGPLDDLQVLEYGIRQEDEQTLQESKTLSPEKIEAYFGVLQSQDNPGYVHFDPLTSSLFVGKNAQFDWEFMNKATANRSLSIVRTRMCGPDTPEQHLDQPAFKNALDIFMQFKIVDDSDDADGEIGYDAFVRFLVNKSYCKWDYVASDASLLLYCFEAVDHNNDGVLQFEEFVSVMTIVEGLMEADPTWSGKFDKELMTKFIESVNVTESQIDALTVAASSARNDGEQTESLSVWQAMSAMVSAHDEAVARVLDSVDAVPPDSPTKDQSDDDDDIYIESEGDEKASDPETGKEEGADDPETGKEEGADDPETGKEEGAAEEEAETKVDIDVEKTSGGGSGSGGGGGMGFVSTPRLFVSTPRQVESALEEPFPADIRAAFNAKIARLAAAAHEKAQAAAAKKRAEEEAARLKAEAERKRLAEIAQQKIEAAAKAAEQKAANQKKPAEAPQKETKEDEGADKQVDPEPKAEPEPEAETKAEPDDPEPKVDTDPKAEPEVDTGVQDGDEAAASPTPLSPKTPKNMSREASVAIIQNMIRARLRLMLLEVADKEEAEEERKALEKRLGDDGDAFKLRQMRAVVKVASAVVKAAKKWKDKTEKSRMKRLAIAEENET